MSASIGHVVLRHGVATDTGHRRKVNEDSFLISDRAYFVADGMGGHEAGDVASERAIDALRPLAVLDVITRDDIDGCLAAAQAQVRAIPTAHGAGTTVTGVVVAHDGGVLSWMVANVGDSRTYLMSRGHLGQVSIDHSEVQEMVDAGRITAAEASHHPRRNVVTRAIGADEPVRADHWSIAVRDGDRVLVCSDGLTKELTDAQISDILSAQRNPQVAADLLLAAALDSGGQDNITVIVIDADSDVDEETVPRDDAGEGDALDDDNDDTLPGAVVRREGPTR